MQKSKNNGFIIFSVLLYAVATALMIIGTFNDIKIDVALFNPESMFGKIFEYFGLFVYWGIWGIAFAIIFVCRRDLNESLSVIEKLLPFIKPVKNTQSKAYKFFNFKILFSMLYTRFLQQQQVRVQVQHDVHCLQEHLLTLYSIWQL